MEHNFRLFLQVLEVKDMAEAITNDLVGKYTLPDTVRVSFILNRIPSHTSVDVVL